MAYGAKVGSSTTDHLHLNLIRPSWYLELIFGPYKTTKNLMETKQSQFGTIEKTK